MQSFLLLTNVTFCAIVLLHLLQSENGLANAIPTMNGGDALLLRRKRQDGAEDGADAAGGDENAEGGGDNAEGEGGADENAEGGDDNNAEAGGDENAEEGGDENGENAEEGGNNEEEEGNQQENGGGRGEGRQPPNNGGNNAGGGAGAASCTRDSSTGCQPGYCSNVEWARQHCARTCAQSLPECRQNGAVAPDPSHACSNPAGNCGTNPFICSDDTLAVCGCPQKCGRCVEHQTYITQGLCQNVL